METIVTATETITTNPYPGLRPFRMEEHHLFFGREGQSDEVLEKLSQNRFVAIVGPSGSGKSSFIFCGVLPILYGGFLTDAGADWKVVVTRPGSTPIDNLADAMLRSTNEKLSEDDQKIKRTIASTLLRSSSLGLVEMVQQQQKNSHTNYLILVDQFEELFRFKESRSIDKTDEIMAFINLLTEASNYDGCPVYIAITMRSDFIGDCAQYPDLTHKINDSYYLIPQMTRDQKRNAILGPAAVAGTRMTNRLIQELLADVGDNADQLPIMQHALMRTWDYWSQVKDSANDPMDLKHYEAIGRMAEALSLHANEAYDDLSESQKRICETVFKALTEKKGTYGIRRPSRLHDLAAICGEPENKIIEVLDKFRDPKRSFLTPDYTKKIERDSIVDITHESIMRIWTNLKNWVEDEADAVQMYLRLAEAAGMYQTGKSGLWRQPDLQLALNWKLKHKPTLVWGTRYHPAFERTMLFLEYSKKEFETEQRVKELEQKRQLRNTRIVASVLAGFLIVALIAFVFAFIQRGKAAENEKQALLNLAKSKENEKKAVAQEKLAKQEAANARRAEALAEKSAEEARRERDRAEEQKQIAEQQRKIAEEKEAEAKKQRDEADRQTAIAEQQRRSAESLQKRADRLWQVSVAKAVSLKSRDINDNELATLLARQAYEFNKSNNGFPFDSDIYSGVYSALKKNNDPITRSLQAHQNGAARSIVIDKKTGTLFSGGSDGRVFSWVHKNGIWQSTPLVQTARGDEYQIYTMDVSPDGNRLVAGGLYYANPEDNYVEVYNTKNVNEPPIVIAGFNGQVNDLIYRPDGRGFYLVDSQGHSIKYCNFTSVQEITNSKEKISCIAYNSENDILVSTTTDGYLNIWHMGHKADPVRINISDVELSSVAFSADGVTIAVGDIAGTVRLIRKGKVVTTLSGHKSEINKLCFSHNGLYLASASKDYFVRLWNLQHPDQHPIILTNHDWVWDVAFTLDDMQLLIAINSVQVNATDVDQTIKSYPTQIDAMAGLLCQYTTRNLTEEEWNTYIDKDIKYRITCPNAQAKPKK